MLVNFPYLPGVSRKKALEGEETKSSGSGVRSWNPNLGKKAAFHAIRESGVSDPDRSCFRNFGFENSIEILKHLAAGVDSI